MLDWVEIRCDPRALRYGRHDCRHLRYRPCYWNRKDSSGREWRSFPCLGPYGSCHLHQDGRSDPVERLFSCMPHLGDIDVVLVALSPLDVYYREKLRPDSHSMIYLLAFPSFKEMRLREYHFQFYSAKKDFVADSFAILRGETPTKLLERLWMRLCQRHKAMLPTSSCWVIMESIKKNANQATRQGH